jgi:hypothetical protein
MGCLRRLVLVGIVALFALTFGLSLAVLGSAGVLGKAAILSADDALVLLFLNAASAGALLVLVVMLWVGGRSRRRLEGERAALRGSTAAITTVGCPRCGAEVPSTVRFCPSCGLARTAA